LTNTKQLRDNLDTTASYKCTYNGTRYVPCVPNFTASAALQIEFRAAYNWFTTCRAPRVQSLVVHTCTTNDVPTLKRGVLCSHVAQLALRLKLKSSFVIFKDIVFIFKLIQSQFQLLVLARFRSDSQQDENTNGLT